MYLIGNGFDIHKIIKTKKSILKLFSKKNGNIVNYIVLGGVKLKKNYRFKAHSDGDVLIHALIDSIISPILKKDIGQLFPDNNKIYMDIPSTELLKKALSLINKNYRIINCDITIVCDKIKISPIKEQIIKNLNNILPDTGFSIKGKTTERGLKKNYCYCFVTTLIKIE
jgi:2-C-methyl-D-erythritol 4-phosphate cytidylyltransferase/2-C-methyl-D-erythritol 2,4-cyclodiphosphate synthase